MTLELAPLLRGEISRLAVDCEVMPDAAPYGIEYRGAARVSGYIENSAGYIRLEVTAVVPYKGFCDRCLAPLEGEHTVEFERTLVVEGTMSEEALEEGCDEYLVIKKGQLELDAPLCEEIFLTFPMQLICNENCRGLCPKCGKRLPEDGGECGCSPREIDPRWLKLRELLDSDGGDK